MNICIWTFQREQSVTPGLRALRLFRVSLLPPILTQHGHRQLGVYLLAILVLIKRCRGAVICPKQIATDPRAHACRNLRVSVITVTNAIGNYLRWTGSRRPTVYVINQRANAQHSGILHPIRLLFPRATTGDSEKLRDRSVD